MRHIEAFCSARSEVHSSSLIYQGKSLLNPSQVIATFSYRVEDNNNNNNPCTYLLCNNGSMELWKTFSLELLNAFKYALQVSGRPRQVC